MFIIYDAIRLDPSVKSVAVCETEWAIDPKEHCMHHEPSGICFRIGMDQKATESDPLSPSDFWARPVGLRDAGVLPGPEAVETLARAAIVLYLSALGFIGPHEGAEPGFSEAARHAPVC